MKLTILSLCIGAASAWQAAIVPPPLSMQQQVRSMRFVSATRVSEAPVLMAEEEAKDVPFEIRFSLGNVVSGSGGALLVYCLLSYLLNNGQADVVQTIGFVYAIPALVGGLALKYAELPPVPLESSLAAEAAREAQGTVIMKKLVSDVTRYTYGDAHMEDQLRVLKLAPRGMAVPNIVNLAEFVTPEGKYGLTMRFSAPNTPYSVWKDRAPRFAGFFGGQCRAQLKKYSSKDREVEVTLIRVDEGDDITPTELMADGSIETILTAQQIENAAKAAKVTE